MIFNTIQERICTSTSLAEADYYAYSSDVKDLGHVRLFLRDLRIFPDDAFPPTMLVDSEPAIGMSQGPTNRSSTKHIDFTKALVLDYIQHERAVMENCPTDEQITDMGTKQLGPGPFVAYRGHFMGLVPFLRT